MTKALLTASIAAGFMIMAEPASAQFRFDPRIDPSNCHWTEICDYGGRAYLYRRVRLARCPVEVVERRLPDGSVVVDRRRDCTTIRVRG